MIPVLIMTLTFLTLVLVFLLVPDRPKSHVPSQEANKQVFNDALQATDERQKAAMVISREATQAASTSGSHWGGKS